MKKKIEIPDLEHINPEGIGEWFFQLKEPKLLLTDLGITNKIFYDWRMQEIVPPTQIKSSKETYKELRFSFFETVWLQIVKDLRLMGLSYESIRLIKNEFWSVIPADVINSFLTDEFLEADSKVNPKFATVNKKAQAFIKANNINLPKNRLVLYWFEAMVNGTLLGRDDMKILFRYDGCVGVLKSLPPIKVPGETEMFSIQDNYNKEFAPFPHLILPLEKYIKDFFMLDESPQRLNAFGIIDDNEREVLEVIRSGNLKEITIKMDQKDNTIKSYEIKKDGDITKEELFAMTRTFFLKEYQSVTFRWKNNKSVYFERTSKKHMK